jgi:hypothetical protein
MSNQSPKSVFDDRFHYLKIPATVMQGQILTETIRKSNPYLTRQMVPHYSCPEGIDFNGFLRRLDPAELLITSRVIFWTRKGMPCTQSNAQFAELIGQSERTAKRIIEGLIKQDILEAFYPNRRSRDLTALVGVEMKRIMDRRQAWGEKQAQREREGQQCPTTTKVKSGLRDTGVLVGGQQCPSNSLGEGQRRPSTTKYFKTKDKQLRASPAPLPAEGQPQATPLRTSLKNYFAKIRAKLAS